jgi:hypothetical protein
VSFLPTDWPSFVWGAAIAGLAAFGTGFLKNAGEHTFTHVAGKLNPKPPEPERVDGRFVPTRFAPGVCAWVNEQKLYEYEEKGYTYYPHPKNGAYCFRNTSDGRGPVKEFLLVQPGAQKVAGA